MRPPAWSSALCAANLTASTLVVEQFDQPVGMGSDVLARHRLRRASSDEGVGVAQESCPRRVVLGQQSHQAGPLGASPPAA